MLSHVLFDLDGTLTDPMIGITNSIMYALAHLKKPVQNRADYYAWIGPPLLAAFRERACLSDAEAHEALRLYRVYFSEHGILENKPYEGMSALLERLTGAGLSLYLATSKPEEYATVILEHFNLRRYFTFVAGNTLSEARPTKEAVLRYLMDQYPNITPDNTVMVGDRRYDVEGARAVGIKTVGVLFGYGSEEELKEAGALQTVKTPNELGDLLLSLQHSR